MTLKIYLLGQFKLESDQLSIELPSRPAQSLLAYLAMNAGVTHRREILAGLLWSESPESNARGYLRQALWRIRKALESRSLRWDDFLYINEISVTFNEKSAFWLDIKQFLESTETRSLEELIEDIRLYHGELLPGFYDEWIRLERDRLLAAYYQKMNRLLDRLIQARRWDEVLKWGEHWILQGYSPEPAFRALMQAYAGLGNPGMVGVTYQRCEESLNRELGVLPSPETTHLYEQIRRGERFAFDLPPTILIEHANQPSFLFDQEEPHRIENLPFVAREMELEKLELFLSPVLTGQGRVVFLTGEAGSGKTALINEFIRRVQKKHADLIVARGDCNAHTGIGDPYLPFREILDLLTGDVEARWSAGTLSKEYTQFLWDLIPVTVQALLDIGPDLIDTFISGDALFERAVAYSTGEADWLTRLDKLLHREMKDSAIRNPHQSDLFIQYSKVLQILSRRSPLVLVVDDLQWADLGSISLLFHLGRHLTGSRILVMGAYRPEEINLGRAGERHPLEPVVNELRRVFGDIEVNVDQINGRSFVDALLDCEPNQLGSHFREMLYQLTRGHPLFTIELLRGMQERGDLVQDVMGCWVEGSGLDWEKLPVRIEAVIAERIGRLDQPLQAELRTASVEGEVFTAEVVAQVQARPEVEVLNHLSHELDRKHRLIRAQTIQRFDGQLLSRYRFQHILVQRYLYHSLDEVERVHLHEHVGNILENIYENQIGTALISPQLARHFQEARITEKAIYYLQQSGERALQMSAYQEAINHLNRGLDLFATLSDPHKYVKQELSLQLAISMALHLSVGFTAPGLERAAAKALELGQQIGTTTQLCQAMGGLVLVHYVRAENSLALELAEKALILGQQSEDQLLIGVGHWYLGFILFAVGEYQEARNHLEQILSFYKPQEHHRSFVILRGVDAGLSALAYLACCLWCLGYPEQAQKRSQEALELAHDFNHSFSLVDVLRYGGCEFHKMRRDAQSLKVNAEELIRLSQEKEFTAWLATGKYSLGEALVLLGQLEEGINLIREGLDAELLFGVRCSISGSYIRLAEAYATMGDLEQGESVWAEAFELMEQTGGWQLESELYRLKAALWLAKGDPIEAENYLHQAIEVARRQNAKSWELLAAMDLYRLWCSQGKDGEAYRMLSEVYNWFSEGFSTPDLVEARKLLDTNNFHLSG